MGALLAVSMPMRNGCDRVRELEQSEDERDTGRPVRFKKGERYPINCDHLGQNPYFEYKRPSFQRRPKRIKR